MQIDGLIQSGINLVSSMPAPKYGPPIVKYGPPVPQPDYVSTALHHPEGIIALLLLLCTLAFYSLTVLGWVFQGGILYLKTKEKNEKR